MDFKQLTYFITVVNEGTISAAAKKLHMTQPPLSTQLKLLEEEVGCVLFERGPRAIHLTDAGRIMYEKASSLLHMSSMLEEELKNYRRGAHGTLRLGLVSSVSSTLFCQWFQSFHKAFPDIDLEISEANTYQLLEKLRDGLIELAIVRTPFPSYEFQCIPLKKEAIVAAGHRRFFEGQEASAISLASLAQKPLIFYRRWEPLLSELFHDAGLGFAPFCKNDDARTTAALADAGLGIGIMPESSVALLRSPDILWKVIDEQRLTSDISLIRSKGAYLSAVARTFMEHMQKFQ